MFSWDKNLTEMINKLNTLKAKNFKTQYNFYLNNTSATANPVRNISIKTINIQVDQKY